jgi:transcription initiation factor TFIIIB Brf1 subunit/transcription initiation factor TFIIB
LSLRLSIWLADYLRYLDTPLKYISSFVSKLNLCGEVELLALHKYCLLKDSKLVGGKNPRGVAAGLIYISCIEMGIFISKDEISHASGISKVTLNKRLSEYTDICARK